MSDTEDFQDIGLDAMMAAIREKVTADFDLVVGIERGGVLPACFRDDTHRPMTPEPALVKGLDEDVRGKRVLLADDVGNTGATLRRAAEELEGAEVTTLVISGNADISLFGPHDRCIRWPWDHN